MPEMQGNFYRSNKWRKPRLRERNMTLMAKDKEIWVVDWVNNEPIVGMALQCTFRMREHLNGLDLTLYQPLKKKPKHMSRGKKVCTPRMNTPPVN
jgi:hypothetical protein